jgi:hypothetical protein
MHIRAALTEQRLRKQTCLQGNNWKEHQRSSVFCAARADMLKAGQLVESRQLSRVQASSYASTVVLRVLWGMKREPSVWRYKWVTLFLG